MNTADLQRRLGPELPVWKLSGAGIDVNALLQPFLGTGHATFEKPNGSIFEQVANAVEGVPDATSALPDGSLLFAGCKAHDCVGNWGAMLMAPTGEISGAALIHYHCDAVTGRIVRHTPAEAAEARNRTGKVFRDQGGCDVLPTVTAFVRRSDTGSDQILRNWAEHRSIRAFGAFTDPQRREPLSPEQLRQRTEIVYVSTSG
jgi:hypothetical protein